MALDYSNASNMFTPMRRQSTIEEVESYRGVDISASFPHIATKELSEGAVLSRHNDLNNSFHLDPAQLDDQPFQQQIMQLKKQQQLQQQILLQHFQAQQQQLAEQHEQQLRQHLKEFWQQQRALEEQRERRERDKLEALKRKEKHEQSAVASHEVKLRLQGFLLGKKQRESATGAAAAAATNGTSPQHAFRPWPSTVSRGGVAEGGVTSESGPIYHPLLSGYDDDFPLRKTASEPNLLKVRLKQRVIERRANPIARRKDRPSSQRRRPTQMPNSVCSGESGSPPANAPIAEECEAGSMADLSALYTSPSMPNISLGRPRPTLSQSEKLAVVSEAEVRAAFTARLGMPLTSQMLPGTLPFYPSLPVIDGEASSASSTSSTSAQQRHMQALESAGSRVRITDSQVARARLHKQGHRPLVAIGRTQSAPLPLGRPQSFEEHQAQRTHNLLKQHIRQTVLTRTRNSQLEPDAAGLDRLPDSNNAEVIDLTDRSGRLEDRDRQHFLQQQRDLMMRNAAPASAVEMFAARAHVARPLSRALSSPLVALAETSTAQPQSGPGHRPTTGLAFDSLMLKHGCVCGDNSSHPEHGGRLQSVWARLLETGLVSRCDRIRSRKATLEEIQACHSEAHALLFATNPLNRQKLDMSKLSALPIESFVRLPCGGVGVDSDTTWNELHTAPAARLAVGCVVDLALKTAVGDIRNGFAVVRPPGHHAEQSQAMGFCFFNSVAIAARQLQQRLGVEKILIVDWDVHHGNGTQQAFYSDPRVLYISLHRHDDGNFFPGTGGPHEVGSGAGVGANVNVAWGGGLDPPMADAEYLAAFRAVVMPVARAFRPDIVLVSCGFDAASGHAPPLGGYNVSPACFGYMTQQLLTLADGKVVLSLEGGYDLPSICDSAQECVRALLGDAPTAVRDSELLRPPNDNAVKTLRQTLAIQAEHWPCLAESAPLVALAARTGGAGDDDAAVAMAALSMQQGGQAVAQEITSSTEHSRAASEEPMEQEDEK